MDPGCVCDGWDLNWWEIVISKTSAFSFGPCECLLIEFEDVLDKLDFFRP